MARSRVPRTADELRAQAVAKGYKRGVHTKKDKLRKQGTHNSTTKKNQNATLRRYTIWTLLALQDAAAEQGLPPPDEETARDHCLRLGLQAPELATVKDFIRFYATTSNPRLDEELPTVDSINTVAEWFFAGFARVTGTEIQEEDRTEVYHFVRTTLVEEGVVVNKHRLKHNFSEESLVRVHRTLWTKDDLIFIPERYRIQTTFITNVYCWTGARLSAFFTGGLRYEDTEIVLQRAGDGQPWAATWKLNQRWVKNNRDPENIVFGSAHREHNKFIFNETGFLIMMAIADGALFGVSSIEDLLQKRILPGEKVLHLRYNESALKKPILRKCKMSGEVTDEPMPKSAFVAIWKSNCSNADFFEIPTIHAVRRSLGHQVEKDYTPVQLSQLLTQADVRVFGQSYLANCSSVDGQAAFLREISDHRHIEYFQSVERFLEPGLPHKLPARVEDELSRDPELCRLQEQVATLERKGTTGTAIQEARGLVSNYRRKLHRRAHRRFQLQWVRDRRDWKILTDGNERPKDPSNTDLVEHLCVILPERGRLARWMCQDRPLSPESMWQAISDLHSLCTRDLTVLYLPGLNPRDGKCPVQSCQKSMEELSRSQRNHHIQMCIRRDMAKKLGRLQTHIHYCHICFNWVVGEDEWESHCASHLSSLKTKRCGTLSYGNTLIRPAYSPFLLGSKLPAARRLQSWSRDFDLWKHVNDELEGRRWPMPCPHPLCDDITLSDDRDLRFHFVDDHELPRTRPASPASPDHLRAPGRTTKVTDEHGTQNRKRKPTCEDDVVEWQLTDYVHSSLRTGPSPSARPPKKARSTNSTISPSLLSVIDLTDGGDEAKLDTAPLPWTEDPTIGEPGDIEPEWDGDDLFQGVDEQLDDELSLVGSTTTGVERASGVMFAPEVMNNNSNLDALFDQYIRSPSPSVSPPTSPNDTASELSGATLINGEHSRPLSASPDADPFKSPHPEEISTIEVARFTKAPGHKRSIPHIRLLVSRPKITLRLRLPGKSEIGTKKGTKEEKKNQGTKLGRKKQGKKSGDKGKKVRSQKGRQV